MNENDKVDVRLSRVYDNPDDKQALFDDWAPTYDQDLVTDPDHRETLTTPLPCPTRLMG